MRKVTNAWICKTVRHEEVGIGIVVYRFVVGVAVKFMCCVKLKPSSILVKCGS